MRFWYLLIVTLFLAPVTASADNLVKSTLTFQEQVGNYSTYYWRAVVRLPDPDMKCDVTVIVIDKEGNLLLKAVGPVLSADAIFGQVLTVPTAQTALWSSMHTTLGCGR